MATALHWIPDTLYNYSLAAVAANYDVHQKVIRFLPENILFDFYYQLYKQSHLKKLGTEFSDLTVFEKLLKVKDKRCLLHSCFQAIMDYGCLVASELDRCFKKLSSNTYNSSASTKNNVMKFGFALGNFLLDAGWLLESESVFRECLTLCFFYDSPNIWKCILQCHTKLLCIRTFYCKFKEGKGTILEAKECIQKIKETGLDCNFASIYGEFSAFYFAQNNFKEAYRWSVEALKELNSSLFIKDIVRVLCQASKACISRREFERSELLIKQALQMSRDKFGARNLCFASTLVDYGYYLLNVDAIGQAVKTFQTALNLHVYIFGGNNLLVAKCHEYLAHASYLYGYSTGHFRDAKDHADKAFSIMQTLLNEDHILFASVKQIKALILEETAFECDYVLLQSQYFSQALELHTSALQSSRKAFGEFSLCTAKHYENLGQFFQSVKKCKEAQNMLMKTLSIKEAILGSDDYEVGLTAHHLASLYAYNSEKYQEAEVLFLKSIELGKRFFGDSYSRLEYDYRGLLKVYSKLGYDQKVLMYGTILRRWKLLRDQVVLEESEFSPLNIEVKPIAPEDIIKHFASVL